MPNPDGTPTALEAKIAEVKARAEAAKLAAAAPAPAAPTPPPTPAQVQAMPALPIPMGPPATPVAQIQASQNTPLHTTLPVVEAAGATPAPKARVRKATQPDGTPGAFVDARDTSSVNVTLTITGPASDLARILAALQ